MKKLLAAILISGTVIVANSATWVLSEVKDSNMQPVGYIYHTSAIGTRAGTKPEKVITGLRFICSLKGGTPIIGLFIDNGIHIENSISIVSSIDDSQDKSLSWVVDGNLLYRYVYDSPVLISSIKTGKIIKFRWYANDVTKFTTAFSIAGSDFTEFNSKCKAQI
jgi:hypothetical protein